MSKAVIRLGYESYVMETKDALVIHDIIAKAECFKREYRSSSEGGPLYYIWEQDADNETRSLEIIADSLYRMAKLAGKPNREA